MKATNQDHFNLREEYNKETGWVADFETDSISVYANWLEKRLVSHIKATEDKQKLHELNYSANDIDGAYLIGVFNVSGMDGLAKEEIKKALLECKTAGQMEQGYIEKATPIGIAVWRGNIVAVEWEVDGFGTFWDDENIVSIATIIPIK